jgi:hypothetical protein
MSINKNIERGTILSSSYGECKESFLDVTLPEVSQKLSASFYKEEIALDMVTLWAAHLGRVQSLPSFIHKNDRINGEVLSAHLLYEIIKGLK